MNDTNLPLALCLEDLEARPGDARYMQCVALVGRQSGLVVTVDGRLGWKQPGAVACELWRGQDGSLVLFRPLPESDLIVEVRRAGRLLRAPFGKPVILRAGDILTIASRSWKVYVHGATRDVHAPTPLKRLMAGAALALGVASAGCDAIDVRDNPPDSVFVPPDAGDGGDAADGKDSAETGLGEDATGADVDDAAQEAGD